MDYLNTHQFDLGAESQDDATVSVETLQRRATQLESSLASSSDTSLPRQVSLLTEIARTYTRLGENRTAWQKLRPAIDVCLGQMQWQLAAEICNTLFECEHDDSLIALGNGLWLSITFPMATGLTVALLRHVIDDTPADSDGAAVAAAVAAYVVEIRGNEHGNDDATLVVGQLLNDVARRHGDANTAEEFNAWFERLELDRPEKFLVRMRNVIDVLVQGQWWFDRDELQQLIPDEH